MSIIHLSSLVRTSPNKRPADPAAIGAFCRRKGPLFFDSLQLHKIPNQEPYSAFKARALAIALASYFKLALAEDGALVAHLIPQLFCPVLANDLDVEDGSDQNFILHHALALVMPNGEKYLIDPTFTPDHKKPVVLFGLFDQKMRGRPYKAPISQGTTPKTGYVFSWGLYREILNPFQIPGHLADGIDVGSLQRVVHTFLKLI